MVWKNADLSKTVTVRPDGMITLPLIGELRAGGLTAADVRAEIKTRLERYKEVPEVSVSVADVRSYALYIMGEVKTPGRYQVKSSMTLLQALALAGGFTEYADPSAIVVVRKDVRDAASKEQRISVRYKDLIRRGDVTLLPGDTVIVP
jgi:polysaccharide export outer membrane protein